MRVGSQFLVLLGFWLLLSGHFDVSRAEDRYLLACGIVSCGLVIYLAQRTAILDEEGHPIHLALRLAGYLPWLGWEIIKANIDVARQVWSPQLKIDPQLVSVSYETRTDLGTLIYANSITLTPGTVTLSVDTDTRELLVHALSLEAAGSLKAGEMHARVKALEGRGV